MPNLPELNTHLLNSVRRKVTRKSKWSNAILQASGYDQIQQKKKLTFNFTIDFYTYEKGHLEEENATILTHSLFKLLLLLFPEVGSPADTNDTL